MKKEEYKITEFEVGDKVLYFSHRTGIRGAFLETQAVEVLNTALELRNRKLDWAYKSMWTDVIEKNGEVHRVLAYALIKWNEEGVDIE